MAVIYRSSLRTTRMNSVVTDIDSGAGAGFLEIGTTGMGTVLATITLGDPCGTVSGDVLTLSGFPRSDISADATGTAAEARIKESGGTSIITGLTVGTSGANVVLNSLALQILATVTINSATLTHNTSGV